MNIGKYIQLYRKDLVLKHYAKVTIDNYVSQVGIFLNHYNCIFTEPSKINETALKYNNQLLYDCHCITFFKGLLLLKKCYVIYNRA